MSRLAGDEHGPTSPTTSARYAKPSSCESTIPSARIKGLFGIQIIPPDKPVDPPTTACFSRTSGSRPASIAAIAAMRPPPPLPTMARSTDLSQVVIVLPP